MATVDFDKFKRFRSWMTRDSYDGDSARFYKGAVDGLAWLLSELRAQYPGTDRTHEIEAEILTYIAREVRNWSEFVDEMRAWVDDEEE